LRASGKLGLVSFDAAFGAEAQSELMIQGLSDKLCDDVPFIDEETGIKYVVVSVERNACSDLVVKGKPHLKFNGLVAWALSIDDSKWKQKLNSACRSDPTWRYRECIPMDPSDFDIDRHVIPFIPSATPMKKQRIKRDPDYISPDQPWKPSTKSKRTERGKQAGEATKKFFQHKWIHVFLLKCPALLLFGYFALCTVPVTLIWGTIAWQWKLPLNGHRFLTLVGPYSLF
jgi:hypothetical protein